jgi:hypothetical protein
MVDFENILKDADFAPLLMSYVQMSGDTDVLKKYKPYINGPWSFFETVPSALKNELIHKFSIFLEKVPCLVDYKSEFVLTVNEIHEMLNTCVGQEVPQEYISMIQSETHIGGIKNIDIHWRKNISEQKLNAFHVLIIGAGESGICASIKLNQLGINHTIIEKNNLRPPQHNDSAARRWLLNPTEANRHAVVAGTVVVVSGGAVVVVVSGVSVDVVVVSGGSVEVVVSGGAVVVVVTGLMLSVAGVLWRIA